MCSIAYVVYVKDTSDKICDGCILLACAYSYAAYYEPHPIILGTLCTQMMLCLSF